MKFSSHKILSYIALFAAFIALITGIYNEQYLLAGVSIFLIVMAARRVINLRGQEKKIEDEE